MNPKIEAASVTCESCQRTKDLGLSAAIATDKAQILDHEPTVIVQRDFSEIKRALIAKGANFVDVDLRRSETL